MAQSDTEPSDGPAAPVATADAPPTEGSAKATSTAAGDVEEVEEHHPRDEQSKAARRAKYLADAPGRIVKRYWGTLVLIGLFIVASVATGGAWRSIQDDPSLLEQVGYGTPAIVSGRLYGFVLGGFVSPTLLWFYIPLLVLFVAVAFPYERRAGHWRTIAIVVVGQTLGTFLTALFLYPLRDSGWDWARTLAAEHDVGLSGGMFALVGGFTALMQPVWRKRTRVGLTAFLLAMVLNSGYIWDVEHLLSWTVGLLIGPVLLGRKPQKPNLRFGRRVQRSFVALIIAVISLSNLIDALFPGNGGPFWSGNVRYESGGLGLGVIVSSILLLAAADGLRRGHRVAWVFVTTVITLDVIVLFTTPPNAERTADLVLDIVPLLLLLATWSTFNVRSQRRSVRRAGRRLLKVGLGLFVYTALGFLLLQDDFTPHATISDMIAEFATRLFFSTTHTIEPATTAARWFVGSIGAVWLVAVVVTLIGLVYSSRRVRPIPDSDQKMREHLLTYDGGSIGWMNTWKGSTDWFSSNGSTAIGYRVVGTVALALGDPIGPIEERFDALKEFDKFCFNRGWIPCIFGADQRTADLVSGWRWKAVQVAEDDIIPLENLAFKGKSWQDVRTALNKAGKQDITLEVLKYAEAKPVVSDQLYAISNGWVEDKSLPEMGFTLGTLREADDPEVRVHIAINADRTIEGFTSWMPVSRDGKIVGWTLDLMRRREDKPSFRPVMEFLIGASAMQFKEEGYEYCSLSAAPLARAPEALSADSDQRVLQRLLDFMGDALEPYYGFRSLLAFKQKFQPTLEPMYLCFPDESGLAEIGIGVARAYMPEATFWDWVKMSAEMVTTPAAE